MSREPRIDLIYIDSGGGHRAAAVALEAAIRREGRPWEVRLRGAQDLLDSIDFIRKLTGIPFQDIYNIMLRRGWTLGTAQLIPLMHQVIRLLHGEEVRVLREFWSRNRPDLVVSLIPHYNRAMHDALAAACPGVPLVTVLTDLADYPPNFWIERQRQYLICGTPRAVEQARAMGHPASRVRRVSGMILHPRFHDRPRVDRPGGLARLGLRSDLPTGVVLFGGEGSMDIVKVVRALDAAGLPIQLIVLCGKHERAAEAVRGLAKRIKVRVEGFTRDVPWFMALGDFFIGKAGPGSISEALAMGLPVIVERNAWTLAQERYNTDWIVEQGVGVVTRDFSRVADAVRRLLEPASFARYRAAVARVRNEAVFEVTAILGAILEQHDADKRAAGTLRLAGEVNRDAVPVRS